MVLNIDERGGLASFSRAFPFMYRFPRVHSEGYLINKNVIGAVSYSVLYYYATDMIICFSN